MSKNANIQYFMQKLHAVGAKITLSKTVGNKEFGEFLYIKLNISMQSLPYWGQNFVLKITHY